MHLQLKMVERDAVERFAAAVGTPGRIYGPYKNRTGEHDGYPRRDFYVWTTRVGESVRILRALWPALSEFRRKRAIELGFVVEVSTAKAAA